MTDLSQAAIDAAMAAVDELPQPVNPFEADRWRIVAEAAIAVATPYIRAGAVAAERERCAQQLETYAGNYPEDVFPPGSDSRDAIGGTAMRHAYRNAASLLRNPTEGDSHA